MEDHEDILVWPDGTFCDRSERAKYPEKSDDYLVLEVDSEEWIYFDPAQPLRRWES